MIAELEEKRIIRARTALMLQSPFFSSLVLRLIMAQCETIPAMATDGRYLYWNPLFVRSLSDDELKGVVAHEVMHPAMGHIARMGTRNLSKWNIATDAVINQTLLDAGFTLPKDRVLLPSIVSKVGETYAEEVYAKLPDMPDDGEGEGEGGGQGVVRAPKTQGGFGQIIPPKDESGQPLSQEAQQNLEQEWKIAATQAAINAKLAGNAPGNLLRVVEEALRSKVNWREVLRRFITSATEPRDYQWCPPNRRFIAMGMYLPSIKREGTGSIDIHVDVSGSISQELLNQWAGELQEINREVRPEKMRVLYFDHALQLPVEEYAPDDEITLTMRGGGGTSYVPSFEWVSKQDDQPMCAIVLTDLYCDEYPTQPDYPVLFATEGEQTARWGETVRLEEI
jgi:predicted metal-dependent peptidase